MSYILRWHILTAEHKSTWQQASPYINQWVITPRTRAVFSRNWALSHPCPTTTMTFSSFTFQESGLEPVLISSLPTPSGVNHWARAVVTHWPPFLPKPKRERASMGLPSLPLTWPQLPAQLLTLPAGSLGQNYHCVNQSQSQGFPSPPLNLGWVTCHYRWQRGRQGISNQMVQKGRAPVFKLTWLVQGYGGDPLSRAILFLPIFT